MTYQKVIRIVRHDGELRLLMLSVGNQSDWPRAYFDMIMNEIEIGLECEDKLDYVRKL